VSAGAAVQRPFSLSYTFPVVPGRRGLPAAHNYAPSLPMEFLDLPWAEEGDSLAPLFDLDAFCAAYGSVATAPSGFPTDLLDTAHTGLVRALPADSCVGRRAPARLASCAAPRGAALQTLSCASKRFWLPQRSPARLGTGSWSRVRCLPWAHDRAQQHAALRRGPTRAQSCTAALGQMR
jgi:hypothetical protein